MFPRQRKTAFDDDDLKALQRVFDAASAALRLDCEDRALRERLGALVFEMAQTGEGNEAVLWARAVRQFDGCSGVRFEPSTCALLPISADISPPSPRLFSRR
ncbi:MAG TPA: hypothetical protein PK857_07610 [Hyphomicrobium sp.]|nr:hypothetical protein [Hyphomicrobium sp.]HRO49948.1 hypothetical protein [Hyphomicrobium sp.]